MSASIVVWATFIGVTLCILGSGWLMFDWLFRDRQRVDDRLQSTFRDGLRDKAKASLLFKDLMHSSQQSRWRKRFIYALQTWLDQAGLAWSWQHLVLATALCGALGAFVAWQASQQLWLSAMTGVIAMTLPLNYVWLSRRRRLELITSQLPDAFQTMSRALAAGQAMPAAVQLVARDFPRPLSEEFTYYYEQQHLGVPHEVALRDLARRVNVMEVNIFAVALIVQRSAGGNLAELLSRLAELVRARIRLRRRVKALTGEGRMQAALLILLPILLLAALLWIAPDYAALLVERPRLLLLCFAAQLAGACWIYRIVNFNF